TCYERAEALCVSLNRPGVLFSALEGQWRYSLVTDKLSATLEIAKRAYSLAQEQNDAALMIGADRALAVTLYYLGDFEAGQHYARRGVEAWRAGGGRAAVEEISTPEVICLVYAAISGWHLGETDFGQATMAEAISLAKELNDMHALAVALWNAGTLAHFEGDPAEVERLASDLIQLSTRQNFAQFLAGGDILLGW